MRNSAEIRITADAAQARGAFAQVNRALQEIVAAITGVRVAASQMDRAVQQSALRMGSGYTKSAQGLRSISQQLQQARNWALSLASVNVGASAVKGLLDLQIRFDQLRGMLKYVTGDFQAADREMDYAAQVADRLKINVLVATEAYAKLAAAAKGTALEGAGVREVFEGMATASVAMGQTTEQLSGSFLAVTQIMSKQKVTAEELSGQLGERMVGVFQAAARAVGLSVQDFNKELAAGTLEANGFLLALARQFKAQFGGEVADSVDGARGALADFENAWIDLKLAFAQSGFIDSLVAAMRELSVTMRDPQFQGSLRNFGSVMGGLIQLVVRHHDKIVTAFAAITGARIGASIGALTRTPAGVAIGAGVGALGGGLLGALAPELLAGDGEARDARSAEEHAKLLRARIARLEKDRFHDRAYVERLKRGLAELEREIADAKAAPPGAPDIPPLLPSAAGPKKSGDREREAERAARAAETARQRRLEQIKADLAAAQNEMLRLTGHEAEALANELKARYAQLIADLKAQGDTAGAALIENLIGLKVADAKLAELKSKTEAAFAHLRARGASIFDAFDQVQQNAANRVDVGTQSPGAAREDVAAAREIALTQYQALRVELEKLAAASPEAAAALADFDRRAADVAASGVGGLRGALIDMQKELANMKASFAGDALNALRDSLTQLFTDLATNAKNAKDALKDFVRGFAEAMVQIAARILATAAVVAVISALPGGAAILQLAGMGASVKHTGGIVGEGGTTRQVPGWVFAGAARYHTGGIAGLRPGEVPAILRKGEEVITESDPRHIANGGGVGGLQNVRINLLDDRSNIGDYMSSAEGERVLLETLERNSLRARTVLGVG